MPINISIDRGGTFTDIFANVDGVEHIFKILSVDPANYNDAPTEGVRRVLEKVRQTTLPKNEPLDIHDIDSIRMGTTVATNGLLERKGDRVALFVTKGFGDILRLGQQARPDIFDLKVAKLSQLYEEVREVNERVILFDERAKEGQSLCDGIDGDKLIVVQAPDSAEIKSQLQEVWDHGIRSLAISFIHSYTFPNHELEVEKIARSVGFENISVSSQLQPMIKFVSRANSATADAYLSPIITRYLHTIAKGFVGGLEMLGSKLLFMQSDGGLSSAQNFCGLKAILSGPAGGVVGYARTSFEGERPILGFDMGGTSTDVSRYDGTFDHIFETTTAQVVIQAPQLAIETVAAGGGSILFWRNGLYVVGPESAGSHPGPACYRKGGPLTVTDANLVLGRIDLESFPRIFGPNKDEGLDIGIVREKFKDLAQLIGADTNSVISVESVALGFLDVANETMCRPIRTLTEGKGYNTSNHVLACFGGAGGQHAAAVGKRLGISEVIIHKYSSLLSAFGIALADVVADIQKPVNSVLRENSMGDLHRRTDGVASESLKTLEQQGFRAKSEYVQLERYLNCRYEGSDSFMMIKQSDLDDSAASFQERFIAQHKQEYGFTLERAILVGDVRVRAIYQSPRNVESLLPNRSAMKLRIAAPAATRKQMSYFDNEWFETPLFTFEELQPGSRITGPAIILDDTQTLVIEPHTQAEILDNHVVLRIEDSKSGSSEAEAKEEAFSTDIDSVRLSVFSHRFMSIAEQMGQTLRKTAMSVNIKERLDFSCAIFDPQGGLVANAPHIPVHLGSMSSAVEFQQQFWRGRLKDGDVLVANHPAFGGSHLPDITVITPVFSSVGSEIIFWVASRGHHSDIGGITAGSMPPFSSYLWQEGACIKGFKVVCNNIFDHDGVVKLLYDDPSQFPGCSGSRSLQDSISDLKAQIAANNKGIQLIRQLAQEFTLPVVQKYMYAIQHNAEIAVRNLIRRKAETVGSPYELHAEDQLDDGSPLKLKIVLNPKDGSAKFDFSGTGPQLHGNLNAPKAITFSAIMYCLRTMISEDIPLNQGCLAPLDIIVPQNSFLAPSPEAATVGGNVETSQRVTDVVFQAFEAVADSQGTCNNLTFGSKEFGYYETIGGGAGAGPDFEGQSGVQIHMTNTRSTDPEIFEKRYPVILREFSLRKGSGGTGRFKGGDGIIRDIEFRCPVQLSILSERRARVPHGLKGGADGLPGQNLWISRESGTTRSLGGKNTVDIAAGDRIIIKTPGGGGYGRLEDKF